MIKREDVHTGSIFILKGNLSPKGKYKNYYGSKFEVTSSRVTNNCIAEVECLEDGELFYDMSLSFFDYPESKKELLKAEIVGLTSKISELQAKLAMMEEYGLEDIDPLTEKAINLLRLVNKGPNPITKEQVEEAKKILS